MMKTVTTLPPGSEDRKRVPLFRGLLGYFPAALMGVAQHSMVSNEKHNPGEELHHARGKSMDHADCIIRHLMDLADIKADDARGYPINPEQLLEEVNALCWRALALSQEVWESLGAPLAPGARYPDTPAFDAKAATEALMKGTMDAPDPSQDVKSANAQCDVAAVDRAWEAGEAFDRGVGVGYARGLEMEPPLTWEDCDSVVKCPPPVAEVVADGPYDRVWP